MSVVKNLTSELTTGLPPWAKGVATLAILGGVGFGIYKLIKNINTIDDKLGENKEEKVLKQQGQKNWYSKSEYQQIANDLYFNGIDTLNPFDRGNEDALYKFAGMMKSDLDVLAVRQEWGSDKYRCSNTFNYMPLAAWVNCMYDTDEVEQANKILASKKINFRF
jgi:hypothetical protein